jgi:hypothetical protein
MIRIGTSGKAFSLWLPLLLLWLVYFAGILLLIPFAFAAEIFLYCKGIRPLSILFACMSSIASLKGLSVDVQPSSGNKGVNILIV